MKLPPLLSLRPIATPGHSAAAYVPWVMASRALAFLRTLLVANLLGAAGKAAFGMYQPALEFINPLTALVMFGAADVAERYTAAFLRNAGPLALRRWLYRQWFRLAITGVVITILLYHASPWISVIYSPDPGAFAEKYSITLVCGIAFTLLALYQHLAATLRALRAYGAAAGMEFLAAFLLLTLSSGVAWNFSNTEHEYDAAFWLLLAYSGSVAIPLVLYASLLNDHLGRRPRDAFPDANRHFQPGDVIAYASASTIESEIVPDTSIALDPNWKPPRLTRFALWALIRLLLVMLFSFLSIWGVLHLYSDVSINPLASTASFSIPFRIAQLLAFLAVTLWASSYGIAARAHSHHQSRRAYATLFRIGRLGTAALLLLATALLLSRDLFAFLLPAYAYPIHTLLPGMLALFLWYGLASFFSTYADLRESPWRGAAIWATAILFQIAGILLARFTRLAYDPQQIMLYSSAAGLLAALLITTPALLARPFKLPRTALPLAILTLAPAAFFLPLNIVNYLAPPILLLTLLALYLTNTLVRPHDRRAFKKWRSR